MNTPAVTSPAPVAEVSPIGRIQRLALRARGVFPECTLSWSLVLDWCREHILLQRRWSREAQAVDDPLERIAPELADCLRNDPPETRRRILHACRETHRRSQALAAELER